MEFGQIVAPTIKELFTERIEGLIFSGSLKPGDRIPSERDLAEQMKISKTIVHMGLEDLERMGFIIVIPRRGTFVANFAEAGNLETLNAILRYNGGRLDRQMVVSIIELRDAIEGASLRRLGKSRSEQDVSDLHSMMEEFAETAKHGPDITAIASALARFHYKICMLSGNRLYPLIMNAFRGVGTALWESSVNFWGVDALLAQGNKLVELVAEGRGEEAAGYLSALFAHYLDNTQ